MAPARTAKNISAAKAADALVSSPVSLIWAHQLRREHAALLTRIEDLAAIFNIISPSQISNLDSRVQFIENQVKELGEQREKKNRNLNDQISKLREDLDIRVQVAKDDGEMIKNEIHILDERLVEVERRRLGDRNGCHADMKRGLELQKKEVQGSLEALITRIAALEARPQVDLHEAVTVVKDSVEVMKEQMKAIVECSAVNCAQSTHPRKNSIAPTSVDVPEDESDAEQDMLTLHVSKHPGSTSSLLGDIDLDEDSVSLPDLAGRNQDTIGESMAMIQTNATSGAAQSVNLSGLKQEKFQTWSSYLREGQAFVDALPKRKELAVVEIFVNGIYDQDNKFEVEGILDRNGWTWANVEDSVEHHIYEEMQTQAVRARSKPQIHRHQRGAKFPACQPQCESPGQGAAVSLLRLENDLPEEPHRQEAHSGWVAQVPLPRRSERIQILEVTQKSMEATVMLLEPEDTSKESLKQKPVKQTTTKLEARTEKTAWREIKKSKLPEESATRSQKRKKDQKPKSPAKKAKSDGLILRPSTPRTDARSNKAVVAEGEHPKHKLDIEQKGPARKGKVAKNMRVPKPIPKIPIVSSSSDEE